MQLRTLQSGPSWKLLAKMYPRLSYESYLGAAILLLVDAVAVELEGVVAGVDAHRDGAVGGDGRGQSILVPSGDVHVASFGGADCGRIEVALALKAVGIFEGCGKGEVGVALLGVDALFVVDKLRREVNEKSSVAGKR